MPDLADYMTVQETAEKLGFHVDHVRRMRRQGVLEAFKIGSTWLISKASVDQYLASTAGTGKHDPLRRKKGSGHE
jgi:excisionase family DNA binding protein